MFSSARCRRAASQPARYDSPDASGPDQAPSRHHAAAVGADTPFRDTECMRAPIPGGPGWQMNGDTLRAEITDLSMFLAAPADDPFLDVVVALFQSEQRQPELRSIRC